MNREYLKPSQVFSVNEADTCNFQFWKPFRIHFSTIAWMGFERCKSAASYYTYHWIVEMAKAIISKKRKFVADGVFYSEVNEVHYV